MEKLINTGIIQLNKAVKNEQQKTIVVMGVARSGTSMVAAVLEKLGVFMGENKDTVVFEDLKMANIFENNTFNEETLSIIEDRNSKYDIWGWKRPGAINYVEKFENKIRNPHYIILFRDNLAITLRNQISVGSKFMANLKQTHNQYKNVIDFISNTNKPCLLISYEKAISKRKILINELCKFIDIDINKINIADAMNAIELDRKDYLFSARIAKYRGVLDGIKGTVINGWIAQERNNNPIEIDILVDNKIVHTMIADEYRDDLKKSGIGSGNHSFKFDLCDFLSKNGKHKIQVISSEFKYELKKSPMIIHSK